MVNQEETLILEMIKELVSTEEQNIYLDSEMNRELESIISALKHNKPIENGTQNNVSDAHFQKIESNIEYLKEKYNQISYDLKYVTESQQTYKNLLATLQKSLFEFQKNITNTEETNQTNITKIIAKYEAQEKFLEYFLQQIKQWENQKTNINQDNNIEKTIKLYQNQLENDFENKITKIEELKKSIEIQYSQPNKNEKAFFQKIQDLEKKQESIQNNIDKIDKEKKEFKIEIDEKFNTIEQKNKNIQTNITENLNNNWKNQMDTQKEEFQKIINELKQKIQDKNYTHLEEGLGKINEKINKIETDFEKNNKILEDKISKILKNPNTQVEKEIQDIQKNVEILNNVVKDTQIFLTKNETNIQQNISLEFEKYNAKLEEKQNIIAEITHNFENTLKQIAENIVQNQTEKDNILQKIYSIEKNLEHLIQEKTVSDPNLLPVLVEKQTLSLIPQNTFHEYQYLSELKQTMFRDENYLQTFFPKCFYINNQNMEKTNQFYWLKEKIGLTYLGIVKCNTHENSMLPIILQFIINNLINESKLLDLETFFKELQKRIPENILHEPTNEIKCAIMVLDRINTTMYFMGIGGNLWCGQKNLKKIEGTKDTLEKINFKNNKFKKHTLSATKDSRFYITFEENIEADQNIDKILGDINQESFLRQKNIFGDFLEHHLNSKELWIGIGI